MVHVAKEMQRLGYKQPLLIGGATTSPAHTAVKIDPQYEGAVIYVKDASRSVGVCQQLVTPATREAYIAHAKAEHERRREQHRNKGAKAPQMSLAQARARKFKIDWSAYTPPVPQFLGVRSFEDYPLEELVPVHRLDAVLQCLGIRREISGHFARPDRRRGGQQSVCGRQAHAGKTGRGEMAAGARRRSASFPPTASATTTSRSMRTSRAAGTLARLHHLRQQKSKPQGQAQLVSGGLHRAGAKRPRATTSARSP